MVERNPRIIYLDLKQLYGIGYTKLFTPLKILNRKLETDFWGKLIVTSLAKSFSSMLNRAHELTSFYSKL